MSDMEGQNGGEGNHYQYYLFLLCFVLFLDLKSFPINQVVQTQNELSVVSLKWRFHSSLLLLHILQKLLISIGYVL